MIFLRDKVNNAPKYPGCYLFKDEREQIIYVGMSKFLPKRVKSYFTKKHDDLKTQTLVENIRDVEFQIASSEQEAIVMEEELIKLYKPKFNIKGKDDKTRKWSVTLTQERFPKLEIVRAKDDDRFSFDFTSGFLASQVFELLTDLFPLRSCSYDLTQENIDKGKFKTCLEYQMGRCSAPCVGLVSTVIYQMNLNVINKIFQMDFGPARKHISRLMKEHSSKLEFELAHNYKIKLETLKELEKKVEPVRVRKYNKKAFEMKKLLKLKQLPLIIEAFDNSHNQGDCNVAASVRFLNEKPEKSQYRKYNIKTVVGVDDYASFEEILDRRFSRLISEKQQLPHLVVIDGGVGQLNVARRVFEKLDLLGKIDLISISKDKGHRSSLIHTLDGSRFQITDSLSFTHLGEVQEEVHRFAIKFHREKTSKKFLGNR
jgi:excinuclease UvrABC nuclease subunit